MTETKEQQEKLKDAKAKLIKAIKGFKTCQELDNFCQALSAKYVQDKMLPQLGTALAPILKQLQGK